MAADAGVSAGVVLSGLVIRATDAVWLDPVVCLVIAGVILISTWNLLRDSFHLAMGGVPHAIDLAKVRDVLSGLEGVDDVHDLHVWSISTTEVALTAHLVKPVSGYEDDLIEEASRKLKKRFHINHITLQSEQQKLPDCQENAEGWEI
jgi:cobalt-zinc-cadmium efflux system protein